MGDNNSDRGNGGLDEYRGSRYWGMKEMTAIYTQKRRSNTDTNDGERHRTKKENTMGTETEMQEDNNRSGGDVRKWGWHTRAAMEKDVERNSGRDVLQ